MVNQSGKESKLEAPPYVSFQTLWNFLDRLGEVGTPPRIDRSVWGDRLSGGYGFQLMAALRFLKLIDEDGDAYAELRHIAEDVETRRNWLKEHLVSLYAEPIQRLDLSVATMQQLQEAFRAGYSVTGATMDKSISFFLHALRAGEVPLSPYIERNVRKRSTTRKKPKTATKPKPTTGKAPVQQQSAPPSDNPDSHERIITLRSGGTVRISMSYNAFKMSKEDREFVFDLVDKIQGYETGGEQG